MPPLILILSYYFPPSPAIGGVRPYRWYKYLKREGFPCRVITATSGAEAAGTDIIEVPDPASCWNNESASEREDITLAAHFDRAIRALFLPGAVGLAWSPAAVKACRRILGQQNENAVIVSSYPPIGANIAGLLAHRATGVPWVADFRDPLTGTGGWFSDRFVAWLEKQTFRQASAIIANVDSAGELYAAKAPAARHKIHVIWNGYDPEDNISAEPVNSSNAAKILLHAGSLYGGRNANGLVLALQQLRESGAVETDGVILRLLGNNHGSGSGADRTLYDSAIQQGWLKLDPPVSPSEALRATATAHGLVILQPHTTVQVPGKLFQYICIGRPILAVAPRESAVERILLNSRIPHVCLYPDDTPDEESRKLLSYLRLPSEPTAPDRWFTDTFDSSTQTRQLASILCSVVDAERRRQ